MTLCNFPPADQCEPEDLDAIADFVVRDPRASYDLAGSREHIEVLCRRYQIIAQHLVEMTEERDDLWVRCGTAAESRKRLGDLAGDLLDDLASAHTEIRALTSTLNAERNERQGEVLQAEQDRERADAAEERVEQLTEQLDAMALLLDSQRETREANDRIRSACASAVPAICDGVTVEELDAQLDADLAAHPELGPL